MKPVAFDYARAEDPAHAVELLGEAAGSAKIIAGGQSLGPMLNLRLVRPKLLVDVRRCPDLRGAIDEGDAIVYGSAVTHAEIEDGAVPDATPGWLARAARRIAYRAVRNRGTLGGSVAHADPAADWPTVLLALGAEVVVQGQEGCRAIALPDFVRGPFETDLADDEVLVGVRVPKRGTAARFGCCKISVKVGEFARALGVVLEDSERGESVAVVGAIERAPLVLEDANEVLEDLASAEGVVARHLPSLSATARRLHGVALSRAAEEARAQASSVR